MTRKKKYQGDRMREGPTWSGSRPAARVWVCAAFTLVLLQPLSTLAGDELRLCLSALTLAKAKVEKTTIDPKIVGGIRGMVLWSSAKAREINNEAVVPGAKLEDLRHCEKFGSDPLFADVLVQTLRGYMPDNPRETLAVCYAGMLSQVLLIEQQFGSDAGSQLGFYVGGRVGSVMAALRYTNPDGRIIATHLSENEARAMALLQSAQTKPRKEQEVFLASAARACQWFRIDIGFSGAVVSQALQAASR